MEVNIVTIIAKNYLAQARVLTDSFKNYHPNGKVFVLFIDEINGYVTPEKENFITIKFDELRSHIEDFDGFCFQYSILELCTAAKPYLLKYLFEKYNLDTLIYFDPDILITESLQPIRQLLNNFNIILTPHITKNYTDEKHPSEVNIMQAGTYNLGFIALANTPTSIAMLNWWEKKLHKQCLVDIAKGLFVDQKWMNFVPVYFEKTYILLDAGYNIAYWNLHEHVITIENDKFYSNGQLLRFFHFSGYDPTYPNIISKHQNRHTLDSIGQAKDIFLLYAALLSKYGFQSYKKWPYTYAQFDNQVSIPSIARRIYLKQKNLNFGNPFNTRTPNNFFEWLFHIDQSNLSPLLLEIYHSGPEIRAQFPDVTGKDKPSFLHWCLIEGQTHFGLDNNLLMIIKRNLNQFYGLNLRGINISGYLASEKSLGRAVKSDIMCLKHTEFPIKLNDVTDHFSLNQEKIDGWEISLSNPYKINLIHVNADQLPVFIEQKGLNYFEKKYNIGAWVWELANFPMQWFSCFEFLDEIWVPSSFLQESLAHVSPIPVIKVPYAIEITDISQKPIHDRHFFSIPNTCFVFLFIFDFDSYAVRKNPYGLIEAFKKSFSMQDNAVLVIKTSHSERHPEDLKTLVESAKNLNVILLDRVMSSEEVKSLMAHADCYVSLHRCEGFGLTIAEAMSLGKPVIATAYSGNTDFMQPDNCYAVNYQLIEIDQDYGPYKKGWLWADPDLDQASSLMRYVFEHKGEAITKGVTAREFIKKHYSPEEIGKVYQKRLEHIFNNNPETSEVHSFHQQNVATDLEEKTRKLDINAIGIDGHKSLLSFFIKFYKRFIRKSTFWLLHPLMTHLRELNTAQNILLVQSNQTLLYWNEKTCLIEEELRQLKLWELKEEVKELKAGLKGEIRQLKGEIRQLKQDQQNIHEELKQPLIHSNKKKNLPITEKLDYFAFEEVFRGSEELLKNRLEQYIGLFKGKKRVLDIGCGRGEFLELLQLANIDAIGVDNNEKMIQICKGKGLNVVHADFMEYLMRCEDNQFDVIFSSQFIEHIMPEQIHTFFLQGFRKLKLGGMMVSETVNPYNLSQFRFFWVDPTHKQPIYPEVATFLSNTAGFKESKILYLPCFGETRTKLREPWDYGDYALIAVKKKVLHVNNIPLKEAFVDV